MSIKSAAEQQIAVDKQPKDTVSDLKFCAAKPYLGATSWDGSVRVYEIDPSTLKTKTVMEYIEQKTAFLRICFNSNGNSCYVASSNNEIIQLDIKEKPTKVVIGSHQDRIVGLAWLDGKKSIVACSADKVIQLWDPTTKKSTKTVKLITGKPTYMSGSGNYVMFGEISAQKLHILDFSQADPKPVAISATGLDKAGLITSIAIQEKQGGYNYIAGTTYGYNVIGDNSHSLTIMGHYKKVMSCVYSSNATSVFENIGISGGSDGKIVVYNFENGIKTGEHEANGSKSTPVTGIAYSPAGFVAVAIGNDWSGGREGATVTPSIFLRKLK